MDESKGKELYKGLDEYIRQGGPTTATCKLE